MDKVQLVAPSITAPSITGPSVTAPSITASGITASGITASGITASGITNSGVVENVIAATTESTSSLLEQIYNNKTYVYIFIVVLVLAGIGIYLYLNQLRNKDNKSTDDKLSDDKTTDNKANKSSEDKKDLLNPEKDYYIVDPSGKTILINKYFSKILQTEMQEQEIQEQQMMQKQMIQQQMIQQPIMVNNQISMPSGQNRLIQSQQIPSQRSQQRPKLSHPGEEIIPNVNLDEDDNIANQDLTQTEIDELKKQLELMQRKQSAPITAENEGNTEADF